MTKAKQLVARNADAERFGHGFARMDGAPGAARAAAQQVDADQQAGGGGKEQHEIPGAAVGQLEAGEARRVDHDAGGEAALGFVFAAEIDDDEMQRQRADREIKPAQPQRGQAEDEAEHDAGHRRSRQRDPERRVNFAREDAGGEGAGGDQAGMAERDLSGIAGEQHQRQRADRGEKNLAGEIERERRSSEGKDGQHHGEDGKARALGAGLHQRQVLAVVGAEIAAGARRRPKHGRAPRACRTGPRAARSAWRSAPETAPRRTTADRRNRSAAPPPRR